MAKQPTKYVWDKLSRTDQDHYLTILWNDGYSEGAIAKFFHVGKGVIVRRRQSHLKDLKPRDRSAVKSELNIERFHDLIDIDQMDDMKDHGAIPMGPVAEAEAAKGARLPEPKIKPKLAGSEASQCTHRDNQGLRCAYEWSDPKTRRCKKHPL